MDHHCPWMNNCIGYANYRTFFLSLCYMVTGSWYGLALGFVPFLQVWLHRKHENFLVDVIVKHILNISPLCNRPRNVWIFNMTALDFYIVLYPFLGLVTIVMSYFLYSHVKVSYIFYCAH